MKWQKNMEHSFTKSHKISHFREQIEFQRVSSRIIPIHRNVALNSAAQHNCEIGFDLLVPKIILKTYLWAFRRPKEEHIGRKLSIAVEAFWGLETITALCFWLYKDAPLTCFSFLFNFSGEVFSPERLCSYRPDSSDSRQWILHSDRYR